MVHIEEQQLQEQHESKPENHQYCHPDSQMASSPPPPPDHLPVEPPPVTARGYSPLRSPSKGTKPIPIPLPEPPPPPETAQVKASSPVVYVNRSLRGEVSMITKVDPGEDSFSGIRGRDVEDRDGNLPARTVSSILWRQRREGMLKRAALGFRVCAVVFCLISFSVMAADKTRGWAGDSFDRYKEYRYCISVTVMGFAYAGFQAYDLVYNLTTGKHLFQHHFRSHFDFSMDQIFTYLLLSASSAAATRVNIWVSEWGKDKFTEMANASVAMSFLSFTAFAFSSLISGYHLCTRTYN